MVVYGANGAGKSSFIDAVEYLVRSGRIEHLAHEYSGKRQEKAVPNTHRPEAENTKVSITLADGSQLSVAIAANGVSATTGDATELTAWDYRRTILRQGEVADFITGTKGEKYSVLLPLLGLGDLEVAAENLRQLAKAIEAVSGLQELKSELKSLEQQRKAEFGDLSYDDILTRLRELHVQYCGLEADGFAGCCDDVASAVDEQLAESSGEVRRHAALCDLAALSLEDAVASVQSASSRLSGSLEPLIQEKLAVLEATTTFSGSVAEEGAVLCPSCGRSIEAEDLKRHLEEETQRLSSGLEQYREYKSAVASLCNMVRSLKSGVMNQDLADWRTGLAEELSQCVTNLEYLDPEALRASCDEATATSIADDYLPLVQAAKSASAVAPPSAQALADDKQTVAVGRGVISSVDKTARVGEVEALAEFVRSLEQAVREQLRKRAASVVAEISDDVQTMWGILHPDEPVDMVRLYIPDDTDKAIDIALRFYGVEQDSPRLTLSEGHRNSLGLCIFLAMAKREAASDRPILLDDVVVSVDRGHRGMIAELLQGLLADRQVIILTHDRDWYTELRYRLDGSAWIFRSLRPYESPEQGIRWSGTSSTFGDAREHARTRPDSAVNDARKIMDTELALVAERLQLRMPYLRAEKNDRRLAHDFLTQLISDGGSCLQEKTNGAYSTASDRVALLRDSDRLLLAWGNRGSHTFDVEPAEALKLITACENALDVFKCPSCGQRVWFADASGSEAVQCQCGRLRWRYGKGGIGPQPQMGH